MTLLFKNVYFVCEVECQGVNQVDVYLLRLAFRVVTQGYTPFSCVLTTICGLCKGKKEGKKLDFLKTSIMPPVPFAHMFDT